MSDELREKFSNLGLQEVKVNETLKNPKTSKALDEIIVESHVSTPASKQVSTLLHSLAVLSKDQTDDAVLAHRSWISKAIVAEDIKTSTQLDFGWKYLVKAGDGANKDQFAKEAGIGIEVTDEQVKQAVAQYFSENKKEIEEKRYKIAGSLLAAVKRVESLRFANTGIIKSIIDGMLLEVLGPKDERDAPQKKTKEKKATPQSGAAAKGGANSFAKEHANTARSMFTEGFLGSLHNPGENAQKFPEKMKEHLAVTNGKVFTRFPPEPNGYLHIGHSKAIAIDFGYAQYHNGKCYLRFDDTNPESEDDVYVKSIQEIIEWLGFKPYKVTYSSDYFDQLYELAEKLISKGLAYVCFCTAEEMKACRGINDDGTRGGERKACPHRSKDVETNLKEFREMAAGKYGKGEATLRMKQDLQNPNPQMWDLVAYRVMNAPHHRTGNKWKIYPTYDFTHCLVDSMENISHSLCTLEFYLSRESYEWLCDAVEVYRPQQRESGRLNLQGTIMSKRKILKLVNEKFVRGWDDPRLYTLVAIRRRGVPPGAILNFVAELGVTTSNANIQISRFDASIRKYLEETTPRLMMIPDPIPVILDNLPEDHYEEVSVPFKPGNAEMGEHSVPFTRKFFIDRSDFREEPSKDYFRMAPGQSVGLLKIPHNVRVTSFKKDSETGLVTEIHAHYENDVPFKKPKTFIQWVADCPTKNSPVKLDEVRIFNPLFKSDNPSAHPDGFLADINPDSEIVLKNAIIETGFHYVKENSPWVAKGLTEEEKILSGHDKKGAPEAVRFQALRVGYFCVDKDSTDDKIVLNRIVSLKEDAAKNA